MCVCSRACVKNEIRAKRKRLRHVQFPDIHHRTGVTSLWQRDNLDITSHSSFVSVPSFSFLFLYSFFPRNKSAFIDSL